MQKNLTKIIFTAFVLAFSLGIVSTNAQETTANPLRVKAEARLEQKDIRQEIKVEAKGELRDLKDARVANMPMVKREIKNGSTTEMFKKVKTGTSTDKIAVAKKMRKDTFVIRKNALVKQLNIAIENITNIGARIAERIVKVEGEGRDMTEAEASLVIANEKLAKAKIAVDLLAAYAPATTTASTTAEISIEKPRQIGDAAIKAVKEARDAFKKVIQDIAHNMGRGSEMRNATSTATTTNATSTSN